MKHFIIFFFTSIFLFFAPMQGLMIAVGMAIVLETFFSLYRSTKDETWVFNDKGGVKGIIYKILIYEACIICIYTMDFFFLSDLLIKSFSIEFLITKMAAIILIFIESVSIKQNFEKATGHNIVALIKKTLSGIKEVKDGVTDIIEK